MSTLDSRVVDALGRFGVEPQEARPHATFEELDLDSLARAEFFEVLQDLFGVKITDVETAGLNDLADVIRMLESKGAID